MSGTPPPAGIEKNSVVLDLGVCTGKIGVQTLPLDLGFFQKLTLLLPLYKTFSPPQPAP